MEGRSLKLRIDQRSRKPRNPRTPPQHGHEIRPSHRQTDMCIDALTLAKWRVDLVLICNQTGRNAILAVERLHTILFPVIQRVCKLATCQIELFPEDTPTIIGLTPLLGKIPARLILRSLAILAPSSPTVRPPPHRRLAPKTAAPGPTCMANISLYTILYRTRLYA